MQKRIKGRKENPRLESPHRAAPPYDTPPDNEIDMHDIPLDILSADQSDGAPDIMPDIVFDEPLVVDVESVPAENTEIEAVFERVRVNPETLPGAGYVPPQKRSLGKEKDPLASTMRFAPLTDGLRTRRVLAPWADKLRAEATLALLFVMVAAGWDVVFTESYGTFNPIPLILQAVAVMLFAVAEGGAFDRRPVPWLPNHALDQENLLWNIFRAVRRFLLPFWGFLLIFNPIYAVFDHIEVDWTQVFRDCLLPDGVVYSNEFLFNLPLFPALFGAWLIFALLHQICRKPAVVLVVAAVLTGLALFLEFTVGGDDLPGNWLATWLLTPCFALGAFIESIREQREPRPIKRTRLGDGFAYFGKNALFIVAVAPFWVDLIPVVDTPVVRELLAVLLTVVLAGFLTFLARLLAVLPLFRVLFAVVAPRRKRPQKHP